MDTLQLENNNYSTTTQIYSKSEIDELIDQTYSTDDEYIFRLVQAQFMHKSISDLSTFSNIPFQDSLIQSYSNFFAKDLS